MEVWKEGDMGTGSHAKSKVKRTAGEMWQNQVEQGKGKKKEEKETEETE